MAKVNRGEFGDPIPSKAIVGNPEYRCEASDIVIMCESLDSEHSQGFPIEITLTHDEALVLCAALTNRLAMRVNPPQSPLPKPMLLGEPLA